MRVTPVRHPLSPHQPSEALASTQVDTSPWSHFFFTFFIQGNVLTGEGKRRRRGGQWGKGVEAAMDGGVEREGLWDGSVEGKEGAGVVVGNDLKHSTGKRSFPSLPTM